MIRCNKNMRMIHQLVTSQRRAVSSVAARGAAAVIAFPPSTIVPPPISSCLQKQQPQHQRISGRYFSYNSSSSSTMRSYPQYNVWGENCWLSVRVLLPEFRMMKNNVLALDSNKKGRILLEWTPRLPSDGTWLTLCEPSVRRRMYASACAMYNNKMITYYYGTHHDARFDCEENLQDSIVSLYHPSLQWRMPLLVRCTTTRL